VQLLHRLTFPAPTRPRSGRFEIAVACRDPAATRFGLDELPVRSAVVTAGRGVGSAVASRPCLSICLSSSGVSISASSCPARTLEPMSTSRRSGSVGPRVNRPHPYACIVPGSTISSGRAALRVTNRDLSSGSSRVSFVTTSSLWRAYEMSPDAGPAPHIRPPPQWANAALSTLVHRRPRPSWNVPWKIANTVGTKHQRGHGRNNNPPITARPSARSAHAFADAQRHRHHADDHRSASHTHRPEARESRVRGGRSPCVLGISSLAKLTTRMLFAWDRYT